jgi:hypothetical protein
MLYWNTVSDHLKSTLLDLISQPAFAPFRLVGGTALSLHLGHRMSVDIDLFTDAPYDSIDFLEQEAYLQKHYPYYWKSAPGMIRALGGSYMVGISEADSLKVDLYYSMEPFIQQVHEEDGVRMATIEEIAAMKIDVVHRGGRKKDFWDLDEILEFYKLSELLNLHRLRHEYTHNTEEILHQLTNFRQADDDFDPDCKKGKVWELIKYYMIEHVDKYRATAG